jgi:hypothetical protein
MRKQVSIAKIEDDKIIFSFFSDRRQNLVSQQSFKNNCRLRTLVLYNTVPFQAFTWLLKWARRLFKLGQPSPQITHL